jgi:histidinol-phosphate phosphatase family protein
MIAIKQAAILCGGRGTRLAPITDTLPKPMVPVNGIPFLCYLLAQLRDNGILDVILMTGYLGEQISAYFNDGRALGMRISYSHGPVEWDTGRRLYEIKGRLQEHFLLMYSDNFVSFSLARLTDFYERQKKLLCCIVQRKAAGNIRVADDGAVEVYDKTRSRDNLEFVELGYMICSTKIFEFYADPETSFSAILEKLVVNKQVAGMEVKDAYHSISDTERLRKTEEYLRPKKLLIIDRDGVINAKAPRGEYVDSWDKFVFIRENVEGMDALAKKGFSFVIISNQAGIGRGTVSADAVSDINARMRNILEMKGIVIRAIYVCPHHWEDKCLCRKPEPGLFFQASRELLFRLDKTYFIGDDPRDCQAAYRAGCRCVFIGEEKDLTGLTAEERPLLTVSNLKEAVAYLGDE